MGYYVIKIDIIVKNVLTVFPQEHFIDNCYSNSIGL